MSAVSKKVMPASSAESTTAEVASASRRLPKLLQPMPTTDTSNDPIRRISIGLPSLLSFVDALFMSKPNIYESTTLSHGTLDRHGRSTATISAVLKMELRRNLIFLLVVSLEVPRVANSRRLCATGYYTVALTKLTRVPCLREFGISAISSTLSIKVRSCSSG